VLRRLLEGCSGAQAAQFKLTGGEVGKAFEHMQLIGGEWRARLAGKDRKSPQDVAFRRADGHAGEEAGVDHPDHERRVLRVGQLQPVGDHDGSVVVEDQVEDGAGAGDLADALPTRT
jgi:hypothetical protein